MPSSRTSSEATPRVGFDAFYRETFLPEHTHPLNVALHVLAVVGSLAFVPLALSSRAPWLALLYPVVHAAPGLLGHRLFERHAELGDVRVTRKDFPLWWFIAGNHRLAWGVLSGRWQRRTR